MEATQLILEQLETLVALARQPAQRFLSIDQTAAYCGLSVGSVRRLISSGKLTALKPVRGKVLLDVRQVDAVILSATGTTRNGRGHSATPANRTKQV